MGEQLGRGGREKGVNMSCLGLGTVDFEIGLLGEAMDTCYG